MKSEEKLQREMQTTAATLFKLAAKLNKYNKAKPTNDGVISTRQIDETAIYLSQKSREIK
jgi:hypothetical protein